MELIKCLNCFEYYDSRLNNCSHCGALHGKKIRKPTYKGRQILYGPRSIQRKITVICAHCKSPDVRSTKNPDRPFRCHKCGSYNVENARRPNSYRDVIIKERVKAQLEKAQSERSKDDENKS